MARYLVRLRSPKSPAEAFAYMANLSNFAEWDPGVTRVKQSEGEGPGLNAVYDVTVKGLPAPLRYRTTQFDSPNSIVARAETLILTSLDTITVEADGTGSIVTYDAELTLKGPLGLADPILRLTFGRIGDRAAAGLIRVLDGERLPDRSR
ncbi:Polyketide cyclase / dehydrase and lipid transport [Actinobacteria bacterium IMCC26256]|nr:Polyketide cyclase / dehydrase and lipid transport [Actinobacteria bacterium IMCC26256]